MPQDDENGDDGLVRCDACPVLCRIREGRTGACDRYGNFGGKLVRMDPLVVAQKVMDEVGEMVPFAIAAEDWDGALISQAPTFLTGIGATTTYPDYKPAPFIVASEHEGVDIFVSNAANAVTSSDSSRLSGSRRKRSRDSISRRCRSWSASCSKFFDASSVRSARFCRSLNTLERRR